MSCVHSFGFVLQAVFPVHVHVVHPVLSLFLLTHENDTVYFFAFVMTSGWAKSLRTLIAEVDTKRYNDCKARMINFVKTIVKQPPKKATGKGSVTEVRCLTQLRLIVNAKKKLPVWTNRTWVPTELQKLGAVGDDQAEMGSMWLYRNESFHTRAGHPKIVADGIGRWILGMRDCNIVILTWKQKGPTELGVMSYTYMAFLEALKSSEFDACMLNNVAHFPLVHGSVVWIPYGYSYAAIAMNAPDASYFVQACFMAPILFTQLPKDEQVLLAKDFKVAHTMLHFWKLNGMGPLGKMFAKWMNDHGSFDVKELHLEASPEKEALADEEEEEDTAAGAAASTLPGIDGADADVADADKDAASAAEDATQAVEKDVEEQDSESN